MIFSWSMCRTAASVDGIHNEATASMYFFLLHVNIATLLQKSDSFCVSPTAAFTGNKTLPVFLFLPLLPFSLWRVIISFQLVIRVPKHLTPKARESLRLSGRKALFWLNSSLSLVLYTDKRSTGLTHWKNAESEHVMPQPTPAGLHGFYLPDSFGGIEFFSQVSQKNESDYVLLSIREELTPQDYNGLTRMNLGSRLARYRPEPFKIQTLAKFTAAKQKPARDFLQLRQIKNRIKHQLQRRNNKETWGKNPT